MHDLILVFVVCIILTTGQGCILLLDGWTQVSIARRTHLAKIVIACEIVRSYQKNEETEKKTYSADVRVLQVFKGHAIINSLSRDSQRKRNEKNTRDGDRMIRNVNTAIEKGKDIKRHIVKRMQSKQRKNRNSKTRMFNISNFGSRTQCMADVTNGKRYIMFLTVYDRRLSAKYDDIFGAVVDDSEDSRSQVIRALGWGDWSSWQGCSASCNGGHQVRIRKCRRKKTSNACPGDGRQSRACNDFSCDGAVDLLDAFGIHDEPNGVTSTNTPNAYIIKPSAALNINTATIFPHGFPLNFVIVMAFRLPPKWRGALFVANRGNGTVFFSLSYSNRNLFLRFPQNGTVNETSEVFFPSDLSDRHRHHIVLKVHNKEVTLIRDCAEAEVREVTRSSVSNDLMGTIVLTLGTRTSNDLKPFKGELRELLLLSDPTGAQLVCPSSVDITSHGTLDPHKPSVDHEPNDEQARLVDVASRKKPTAARWSPWSACSVSCDLGVQTRELRCNAKTGQDGCPSLKRPRFQARVCTAKPCEGVCVTVCQNGGICSTSGACICTHGYYGDACQHASCYPGCYNGGTCVRPSVCECTRGYRGELCQKAICENGCKNGGRCVHPNVCSCARGYLPPDCSTPYCSSPCLNGATCAAPNKCACAKGYTGFSCKSAICKRPCLNGGRCIAPNKCKCTPKFKGRRCGKKKCRRRHRRLRLVTRVSRKPVVFKISVPCVPWSSKLCTHTKIEYLTITSYKYRRVKTHCKRKQKKHESTKELRA